MKIFKIVALVSRLVTIIKIFPHVMAANVDAIAIMDLFVICQKMELAFPLSNAVNEIILNLIRIILIILINNKKTSE